MDHFIKVFNKKTGKDISKNNRSIQKLRREVEKAKRNLSTREQVRIEVESLFEGADFTESLTRAKFEELNMDLFTVTMELVEKVLKDADMKKSQIGEIVLVGGSTRIPKVKQLVTEFFNKEPSRGINPDEAVAYGAAVQAAILSHDKDTDGIILLDINPLTLGIESLGGVMSVLIPKNSIIPIVRSEIFSTASDNQESVVVEVYEGERAVAQENHWLGRFELRGIKPGKYLHNHCNNIILRNKLLSQHFAASRKLRSPSKLTSTVSWKCRLKIRKPEKARGLLSETMRTD